MRQFRYLIESSQSYPNHANKNNYFKEVVFYIYFINKSTKKSIISLNNNT